MCLHSPSTVPGQVPRNLGNHMLKNASDWGNSRFGKFSSILSPNEWSYISETKLFMNIFDTVESYLLPHPVFIYLYLSIYLSLFAKCFTCLSLYQHLVDSAQLWINHLQMPGRKLCAPLFLEVTRAMVTIHPSIHPLPIFRIIYCHFKP